MDTVSLLRERRCDLAAFGVRRIGLFGSVARNESGDDSDVDLIVQFEPGAKSYGRFLDLAEWLEQLLNRRVDLITTESLSPWIGPRILAQAIFVTTEDR